MLKKFLAIDKRLLLLAGIFTGIILSVVTVKGLAYTDSPDFCQSCHIMSNVHESFMDSTHVTLACSDCHLPNDGKVKRYTYKAKAGVSHVYYNTIGSNKVPDVIHPTADSEEVINKNCIDCHQATLDNVSHDVKDSCISCHQAVPHGKGFKTEEFYQPPKPGELLEIKGGTLNNG